MPRFLEETPFLFTFLISFKSGRGVCAFPFDSKQRTVLLFASKMIDGIQERRRSRLDAGWTTRRFEPFLVCDC